MAINLNNPWFVRPQPLNNPTIKLFCFPFAGGSAANYMSWVKYLPSDVELIAVQLPGRANRFNETPFDDMSELIRELILPLKREANAPFIFFGHSLGSYLAYAAALKLQESHSPLPEHIICSGSGAPHISRRKENLHQLSSSAFIQRLKALNGTPSEILENKELIELMAPMLKADFQIADEYLPDKTQLHSPMTVFMGSSDSDVAPERVKAWQELSTYHCPVDYFEGDHFYLLNNEGIVLKRINEIIHTAKNQLMSQVL